MDFALIGFPLGHSFSKKYFTEKFTILHLPLVYEAIATEKIDNILEWINKNPTLQGFNITIPHKINIIPFLNELSPEAQKVGAVNCVKIYRQGAHIILKGFNTDTFGFETTLKPLLNDYHTSALILGNGGAAKAVQYVLTKLDINYKIVSRHPKTTEITYEQLTKEFIEQHKIIINTSPLGTFPKVEECPNIPYQFLTTQHLLYDLIYNPTETLFLTKGKQQGASVINGYQMLVQQAERSWQIWNDKTL